MEKSTLNLIRAHFKKLENKIDHLELLIKKNIKEEKNIKKGIKSIKKEEDSIIKTEELLEKEERILLKDIKHIEEEEEWDSGIRFYCKFKMMDDKSVITCGKFSKRMLCAYENCPLLKKK